MDKTVEYYMDLPYTIEARQDPEEGWFVSVRELPGCMSQGDTAEEAIEMIQDAMIGWIEVALEDGDPIPEPRPLDDYSGKFVVRVPRSLHRDLVEEAEREDVSLNRYINVALARAVGRPCTSSPAQEDETTWPGLKAAVREALVTAGLGGEAAELDEELFANHLDRLLAQLEAAVSGGYLQDARWALESLVYPLRGAGVKSPILRSFLRAVRLLHQQVEDLAAIQRGLLKEAAVRSRISGFVQQSALARNVVRDASVAYSTSATVVDESFARERTLAGW